MNRMIWKELRENWKWGGVLLGALYLCFWLLYSGDKGSFFFENTIFLNFVLIAASLGGFAFGLMQGYHESAQDRWAFLAHRSLTPIQIANAKFLVGLGIQLFCWVAFLVSLSLYLTLNNYLNHPFYWFTIIPALLASLAFIPMYATGLLIFIWRVRRKYIKAFMLGLVLLFWIVLMMSTQDNGWSGLWGWILVLVVTIPFSISALYKNYAHYGEMRRSKVGSNLFLYTGIVTSLMMIFIITVQTTTSFFAVPAVLQYHHSELWVGESGELYKHRFETVPQDESSKITHELYRFDDLSKPIAVKKLPQQTYAKNIKAAFSVEFAPTFPHGNTGQMEGYFYSDSVAAMPLVREIFTSVPVNKSWPRMTSNGQLLAWYSGVSGLIHVYEKPVVPAAPLPDEYYATTIIGTNGFFSAGAPDVKSFGSFIGVKQAVVNKSFDTGGGGVMTQRIVNDIFMLVTKEGVFTINAPERKVEQIYSASDGEGDIVAVSLQNVESDPLMLIEHENGFRLFATKEIEAATLEFDDDQPPYISHIYLPDKQIGEFVKPEQLKGEQILEVAWLEEGDRLIFATQDDVSSMAPMPTSFSVFELTRDGEQRKQRQFASELLNPRSQSTGWSEYFLALIAPVLMIGLLFVEWTLLSLFSPTHVGIIEAMVRYQPTSFFIMTLVPFVGAMLAMFMGQWYARRKQFSRSQRRLVFWTAFLFGPIGLLALWLIEHPPHLVDCPHCGKKVSVTEFRCANCGKDPFELTSRSTDIISPELTFEKSPREDVSEPQPVG